MKVGAVEIGWLGHAGFLLVADGVRVYIDPYQIGRTRPDADYILITHNHYDHLSVEDIDNIVTDETVLVAPESARDKLADLPGEFRSIARGQTLELPDLTAIGVAAYNTDKKFHPDEKGWIGYLLQFGDTTIYHSGDTDVIDEMKAVTADVAMLPVSGTYVMDAQQAAEALTKMNVKQAIPMHYGAIVGDDTDAQRFKKLAPKGVKVTILEKA